MDLIIQVGLLFFHIVKPYQIGNNKTVI